MKSFISIFINFLFINIFCQQNSFTRYILVEVGTPNLAGVKSRSESRENNACNETLDLDYDETLLPFCLEQEGFSDAEVCQNYFKTGEGHEKCKDWYEKKRSENRSKKCVDAFEEQSKLIEEQKDRKKKNDECSKCKWCLASAPFPFLSMVCMLACKGSKGCL